MHERREAPQGAADRGTRRPVAAPAPRRFDAGLGAPPRAHQHAAPRLVCEDQRDPRGDPRRARPAARSTNAQERRAEQHRTRRAMPAGIELRHLVGVRAGSAATARARGRQPRCAATRAGQLRASARPTSMPRLASSTIDLRARVHVERLQDRAHVDLHRALRQAKVAADHLVGLALREQQHHVALPFRESEHLDRHAVDARTARGARRRA